MHRFRSWTLDPPEWRTQRNRLLPAEGGDGSTLSLDFTTGVLDPRLTLTRSTNATFVNNSGLVQYADANMLRNSTMLTSNAWTQALSGTGSVTINGDGTVRFNGSGGRATWLQTITPLITGLSMTFSFRVTAFTNNNLRTSDLFTVGTGLTPVAYSYTDTNGTTHSLTQFESLPKTGTNGLGVYSVTATTTATSGNIIFGSDSNNVGGRFGDVTISEPQLQYGTVVPRRVYVPNSSTIAANTNTPRFDYDPTTLAPRGLLIEGDASNQVKNSNDIYNASFWGNSVGVSSTQDTTIPDPSGGTTTCKIVKSAGVQYVVRNQPLPTLTVPANSTVHLTASVWLRMDGVGQVSPHLGIYDAAAASFGTRSGASVSNSLVTIDSGSAAIASYTFGSVTGWVRCSVSRSFTNATASPITFTQLSIYIYPNQINTNAATIYAWGAQVEPGLGVSSLIPTGSITSSRDADFVLMSDISSIGFNTTTGGTLFTDWYYTKRDNAGSYACGVGFMGATDSPAPPFEQFTNSTNIFSAARGNSIVTLERSTTYNLNVASKFAASVDLTASPLILRTNLNGTAASDTDAGTGPLRTPTRFVISRPSYGAFLPCGAIKTVKYWPVSKSATELASLVV